MTFLPRVRATGEDPALRRIGARDLPPLIAIKKFSADADIAGLLRRPTHVSLVRIEGLRITVHPRSERGQQEQSVL